MKKILFLFFALMSVTIMVARERQYGPVTLNYDHSTEANSAGVTDVIVLWNAKDAKGINVAGSVTVGGQKKSFCVQGHKGKCIITFRNLVPDRYYSVEWDFIEPTGFPDNE